MNYSLYYPTLTQTSKHLNLCVIRLLSFNDIVSSEFFGVEITICSPKGDERKKVI